MTLLTIDIGGTFIKYGYWGVGEFKYVSKFPTPSNYNTFKTKILNIIGETIKPLDGVAISAPGVMDQKNKVITGISAVPYIHNFPIVRDLEQTLKLPVYIENDANCAGKCEMEFGVGKNYRDVVFIIIGTGVGGTIFIDNKLYTGKNGFAGEFGLIRTKDGPASYSGSIVKSCLKYETATNHSVDGESLFKKTEEGDSLAVALIQNFYENIGELIYNLQLTIDPEIVAIGGGVSQQKELIKKLNREVRYLFNKDGLLNVNSDIRVCEFKNHANLIGAALFYKQYR